MVVARGNAFESGAILEYLFKKSEIKEEDYRSFLTELEQIFKMLFSLIQHLDKN
jgi:four helix bundle protein